MTRQYLSSIVLLILTALSVVLCLVVAAPFLPALIWALTMAVAAHPVHQWIAARVRCPEIAAGLGVLLVALCLLAPVVLLGYRVTEEASQRFQALREYVQSGDFETSIKSDPRLSGTWAWLRAHVNLEEEAKAAAHGLQQRLGGWLNASGWALIQLIVALFTLFFFFRDRDHFLRALRALLPLSRREADETLEQVRGMIHAVVYGNAVVATVQGALGGLMFWFLGIPAALLWGAVMALFSLVPNMGAFVIWLPTAAWMAFQGEWLKAGLLAVWGAAAVGSIDNLLYPMLVGQEMRMHTVPVFIATIGGLAIFGAVGLVLGPMSFACAMALLEVLRRRTVRSRPVEQAVVAGT